MQTIPLSQRKYDIFFIVMFFTMMCIAALIDSVSGLGPMGRNGQYGVTKAYLSEAIWPPAPCIQAVLDWCEENDPVFCYNPPWMKIMALVSFVFYLPFYIFAIYAFVFGRNWIRPWGLMYAWGMFYTLTIILVEEYCGEVASPQYTKVFLANVLYWIFPLILMIRLRSPAPFSRPANPASSKKSS